MYTEGNAAPALADDNSHWRALSDARLIDAMRSSEHRAWFEFHARFTPLLRLMARRSRVSPDRIGETVSTVLDDTALALTTRTSAVPANLRGYLCRALLNHVRMEHRREKRRTARHAAAATSVCGEAVVHSLCSQYALESRAGPLLLLRDGGAEQPLTHAREMLVRAMSTRLTDEERQLTNWIEAAVPSREIAQWLDISYDAALKRVSRMKHKLRTLATQCVRELPERERALLSHLTSESVNG